MTPLRAGESDYSFRVGELTIHDVRVVAFKAVETMSRPFSVRLDLASEDRDLDLNDLVGKPGVLRIVHSDPDLDRFINGIVCRMEYAGEGVRFARYECELVPFLWLLGLRRKCRIFQEMTVVEIVEQVLQDAGMTADMYRKALTKTYDKREYCVQYRESDLDFVHRLLEEEGIFYFFEHTEDAHVMVLGDAPTAHVPIPGVPQVVFRSASGMVEGEEFITHFRFGQRVRPGAVMLRDFKFEQPKLNLQVAEAADRDQGLEVYDYPGEYVKEAVGRQLAKVRLEELQAERRVGRGVTVCRRFRPGFRFTLKDHAREDFNIEYLLTEVTHTGTQPEALEEEPGATVPPGPHYECNFTVIPFATPFRPPRVTPRPVVQGTQTAIVVGPKGEEIYTDEHGRIKVHFHWDREGTFDEKASCWIRVCQGWAGGKYGMFFLPRVNHEVVVDFLEGDPDRPIVVGCVYNGDEMPPYSLPDEKTRLTIKTSSSKGQEGANELRFEDKAGSEQIFLHAQKDLHIRALNDRRTNIGNNSHEEIGVDQMIKVGGDHSLKIDGSCAVQIDGDYHLKTGGKLAWQVDGTHKTKVAGNFYLEANQIVLKAATGLSIVVGGNFVTIDPSGVAVQGTMVKINSGGSALSDSADSPASPTPPEPADEETPGKDTSYTGETRQQVKIERGTLAPKSWIELELKDDQGKPVPGEPYVIKTQDGKEIKGTLDLKGKAKIHGIEPGTCQIIWPKRSPKECKRD